MARLLGLLLVGALLSGCGLSSARWQQGEAADGRAADWSTSAPGPTPSEVPLTRDDIRDELTELGIHREGANCVVDELVRQGIDFSQYSEWDFASGSAPELTAAAEQAGFICAEVIGGETLSKIFGPDALEQPEIRDGFIEGLTSDPAVDRRLAVCIVDLLIEAGVDVFLLIDADPEDPAFQPVIDAFGTCETTTG